MLTSVALVTFTGPEKPLSGVVAYLKSPTVPGGFLFAITNNDGYARWDNVPVPFTGTLQLAGSAAYYEQPVTLPGIINVTVRVGPSPSNPQDILLPPCSPSFKVAPISKEQLRAMVLKGNFGGMVLPGWGLSTTDMLFDPMIPWYPDTVQDYIFQQKRARGLNVINLCSWSNYHGDEFGMPMRYDWLYTGGEQGARDYCIKLRRQGFIPLFHLIGDRCPGDSYDPSGGGCDVALSIIRTILPAIKDVVGAICPGYELRGCCGEAGAPYSAAQYRRMLILIRSIAPDLYLAAHFTAENSAGSSHSPGEAQDPWHEDEIFFWTGTDWPDGSTLMDACFYQAPTGSKLFDWSEWEDRWQEMIDRIGAGNVRWPSLCTKVDLLWGEAGWYDITRRYRTEADIVRVSNRALTMGGRWSFSG
jgi:hypothetical protein